MTVFLGSLWSSPKEVKPVVVYEGERGIALKPMQGNQSSFRVDLGYPDLFHIPAVTSVSLETCEGFLGDSEEFCQAI